MPGGKVFLVGAGPGDPELLTIKGLRCLRLAEVLLYDALTNAALLKETPEGCEKVYVGKRAGVPHASQEEINALLIEKARAGRAVVRLKGGDPFVFGRGGEEAQALQAAGVVFELVPGVTSAIAVPACAGIPVTFRGLSSHVTIVSGHLDRSTGPGATDWELLASIGGTLVILMGVRDRQEIAQRLIAGGCTPDTPVAAVQWGTWPEQVTVRTTLEAMVDVNLVSPSTIVVGEVAGLDLSGG